MNRGIQNLAADESHYASRQRNLQGEGEDMKMYSDRRYSLVSNDNQREMIKSRVDKNPKNFSPYEFDALYKIVLIGESNTGKTSMLVRFAESVFTENYLCTIGVDFKIKTLKIDQKIIKMQIWDTAGQERFRSISHAYYRNSHGCVAIYDITNRASFDSIEEQIQSFISYSAQDVARNIILVGNKTDLEEKRKVPFEEAVRLGKKLNLAAVFETSAKSNDAIDDAFYRSIVNCVDFYSVPEDVAGLSKSTTSRSRKYSQQTDIVPRGARSFRTGSAQNDELFYEKDDNHRNYFTQAKNNQNNGGAGDASGMNA